MTAVLRELGIILRNVVARCVRQRDAAVVLVGGGVLGVAAQVVRAHALRINGAHRDIVADFARVTALKGGSGVFGDVLAGVVRRAAEDAVGVVHGHAGIVHQALVGAALAQGALG